MTDKIRLKDLDAESKAKYETLSPNLKAFTQEYEELTGKVFKITSAKREAKDKIGKGYKHSHHNTGDALDFSAMNYEDYNFLVNTKEGLALMDKYKLGVLDETDPKTLEKTGGTGAHFHLGKDTKLHLNTRQRLEAFDSGVEPVFSYKQRYEMGENPKVITPDVKEEFSVPFEEKQYQDIFTRVAEKEMVKTVKEEQSKDRQEVKKEISREEEFLKNYLTESTKKQTVNNQTSQEQPLEEININVDLQNQLPELPNIFQIPEMGDGGIIVPQNLSGAPNNSFDEYMEGVIKAKIGYEVAMGNPAALRMVTANPKTGLTPDGTGTHYMSNMDNYAVPLLQDKGGQYLEYSENPPPSREDFKFLSEEEAKYFAENYKRFLPSTSPIN